jgi:hypothetical protein
MSKVFPESVHDFRGFEDAPKIAIEVVAVVQALGLHNVEPDDVAEL